MSLFSRHWNITWIFRVNQIEIVKCKSHFNVNSLAAIPISILERHSVLSMSGIAMRVLGTLSLHSNLVEKWVCWEKQNNYVLFINFLHFDLITVLLWSNLGCCVRTCVSLTQ